MARLVPKPYRQQLLEDYLRVSHALRHEDLDTTQRLSATWLLRRCALTSPTLRLRVRAIQTLNTFGLGAPAIIGGGDGAA
jgi:hypothetical protein